MKCKVYPISLICSILLSLFTVGCLSDSDDNLNLPAHISKKNDGQIRIVATASRKAAPRGPSSGSHKPLLNTKGSNQQDYDSILLTITEVSVHSTEREWEILNDEIQNVDLITLSNNLQQVLANNRIQPGIYDQIRLKIEQAYVVVSGQKLPLQVPSGNSSGLKIPGEFTVNLGLITSITLDFDPMSSVVRQGNGDYILKPVIELLEVTEDLTPPQISIIEPAPAIYRDSQLAVLVDYSDPNIDSSSLAVFINGTDVSNNLLATETNASGTLELADGHYAISAQISDLVPLVSLAGPIAFTIDSTPPRIEISPQDGSTIEETTLQVEIAVSDEVAGVDWSSAVVTIDDVDVTGIFSRSGNVLTASYVFDSLGTHTISAAVSDIAGNLGKASSSLIIEQENSIPIPNDPALSAPQLSDTKLTGFSESVEFLYAGENPVQFDVNASALTKSRVAVLRGAVMTDDGQPLSGVIVSIKDNPSYGYGVTRHDGYFDLVVNGGGELIVHYERVGYLPVRRRVDVRWNEFSQAPNIVMIPYDSKATVVDVSGQSTAVQIARASTSSDLDGSRTATILIPPGTKAHLKGGGVNQSTDTLTVRATEYTVGENGPLKMPAELPPQTGYTYAVELSADEAINSGATHVEFSKEVYFYLENFIGFPTGTAVPSGYYNADNAQWLPSKNGRIIQVLSIEMGKAIVDVSGSGTPASLEELSSIDLSDKELEAIAKLYSSGDTLWRVPLSHFSAWDYNWPFGLPAGAAEPDPGIIVSGPTENFHPPICGSLIDVANQTLGEHLKAPGLKAQLVYSSERTPGHEQGYSVKFPVTGSSIPTILKNVEVDFHIAGQKFTQLYFPAPNIVGEFTWDGYDVFGRRPKTKSTLRVVVRYVYDAQYYPVRADFDASFGNYPDGVGTGAVRARTSVSLSRTFTTKIGNFDARIQSLGGWTFENHHYLDHPNNIIYLGGGNEHEAQSHIIETVAGTGALGYSGDGGPATQAQLYRPWGVAVAPDGALLISDSYNNVIRKVDTSGIITTIAGTGDADYGGDGGQAIYADLNNPGDIVVKGDGTILFADRRNKVVRQISPSGRITLFAGYIHYTGGPGPLPEGNLATRVPLGNTPQGIAVDENGGVYIAVPGRIWYVDSGGIIRTLAGGGASLADGVSAKEALLVQPAGMDVGPDGALYFTDPHVHRVRKITQSGTVYTVAGSGTSLTDDGYSGDFGLAVNAKLSYPFGVVVKDDGSFYIADANNHTVRYVDTEGVITTIAGTGARGLSGDGGAATQALLRAPNELALGPNGDIYIAFNGGDSRIRKISKSITSDILTESQVAVASPDGSEVFIFDKDGHHLSTLFANLGTTKYKFHYDQQGRLSQIENSSGGLTQIVRDGGGNISSIVSEFGVSTSLSVNADGYLETLQFPGLERYSIDYSSSGLMTSFQKPNGATSTFSYDSLGRLIKDTNAMGGYTELSFLGNSFSDYIVEITTAEQARSSLNVSETAEGSALQSLIYPNGTNSSVSRDQNLASIVKTASNTYSYSLRQQADPRFAMQAPITKDSSLSTPSGLEQTIQFKRDVSLVDLSDKINVVKINDETTINGKIYSSEFDKATRSDTHTTPEGRKRKVFYNTSGTIAQVSKGPLEPINLSYDTAGRLLSAKQGQRVSSRTYSPKGFLKSVTDGENHTTYFINDDNGRPIKQELPDGQEINVSYDANGKIVSVAPPGRPSHIFQRDLIGRIIAYVPPASSGNFTTTYTYDRDDQIKKITKPSGEIITFDYDPLTKELIGINTPDGNHTYTYDQVTAKLSSVLSPDNIAIDMSYDGFLMTNTSWSGSISGSIQYQYNNNFLLTSHRVNGQPLATYEYDSDGLIVRAGDLLLSRDAETGFVLSSTIQSLTDSYTYNQYGELNTYTSPYFAQDILARDNLGRITSVKESVQGVTTTVTYQYDSRGRLSKVLRNGVVTSEYTYDANSNRIKHVSSQTLAATYDDQDRLLSYGNYTYSYTPSGELAKKVDTSTGEETLYDYDALGKLRSVVQPDSTQIRYLLDGKSRRVGKLVDGQLVQGFLYGDQLNPLAELDSNGQVVAKFVYASKPYSPDYMIKNGGLYRMISDHLGSIRLVIDLNTNSVVQRIDYDEFGKVVLDTNPGFQPFGFAGGIYDLDTGLSLFGARDYDPETGRWTSKDPILFSGGDTNLYGYVLNDPVNLIDPSGLRPGDQFPTVGEAAGDALNYINPVSIRQNTEYGGYITQNPNGTFSATSPIRGGPAGVNIGPVPPGAAGNYHTHGAYDPRYDNERFSPTDIIGDVLSGLPGYLGTPGGSFQRHFGGRINRGLTCQ